jgi:hypothetical protein
MDAPVVAASGHGGTAFDILRAEDVTRGLFPGFFIGFSLGAELGISLVVVWCGSCDGACGGPVIGGVISPWAFGISSCCLIAAAWSDVATRV